MKLTAMVFLSLDGVYQGGGGLDEDTRFGFERGGWQAPYGDEEAGEFITSVYERMDAMLLGRTTFEIWEDYWPLHDGGDPVSHGINIVPKYVPSTTRTDSPWQNTHSATRNWARPRTSPTASATSASPPRRQSDQPMVKTTATMFSVSASGGRS